MIRKKLNGMLDFLKGKTGPVDLVDSMTSYDNEYDIALALSIYANSTRGNPEAVSEQMLESLDRIYANAKTKELKNSVHTAISVALINMVINRCITSISTKEYTVVGLNVTIGCCLDKSYTQLESSNPLILSLQDAGRVGIEIAPENAIPYVVTDDDDKIKTCLACTMIFLKRICIDILSSINITTYATSFKTDDMWDLITTKDIKNCICGVVRTKDIQKICDLYITMYGSSREN